MKNTTLCYLVKDNMVCLGIKQEKLGAGKYNGFGGHVKKGETLLQAALRELSEETGRVNGTECRYAGCIHYRFPNQPKDNQNVHIYVVSKWEGKPKRTSEMDKFDWFYFNDLPIENMWHNDRYWLKAVLNGCTVRGTVKHDGKKTLERTLTLTRGSKPQSV
jgi:8-oxo-dGTP diphosphatase